MKTIKESIKHLLPNGIMTHRLHPGAESSILLTFDDGPDARITPAVLKLLERYHARAIFFVVGRKIEESPRLLHRIGEKGHLIGNHSYRHSKGKMPGIGEVRTYRRDLERCQRVIEKTIGRRPTIFRPPRGMTPASLFAAWSLGLQTILYSIEGGEWGVRKNCDAPTIAGELLRNVSSRDIVLLHDDNRKIPTILEIILPVMEKKNIDLFRGIDHLT